MNLIPGKRVGPYEVISAIGAGGMGVVYRARDTKLDRDVALKILPESFATDPDRLIRFEREAKTLASLNHPNIAAIYGIEETGDTRALVMELVEGEDLSERLTHGAIPLEEALPIARQVAEALEAAHEAGIIHRDLKPANIKVRDDGTVKVLDFGLAKAMDPMASSSPDAANSPTMTSPALTQMGVILGTAAYMAPEQAKGRAVDKRVDIWAFGVVLYEMLTGTRAFKGEDVSDLLVAVLSKEVDLAALPSTTTLRVKRLIARCLDRDARQRLRDIGEARIVLDEIMVGAQDDVGAAILAAPVPAGSRWSHAWPFLVTAAVAFLIAGLTAWRLWPTEATGPVSQFSHVLPEGDLLPGYGSFAVSPDGRAFVYVTRNSLYLRRLGELQARRIPGSESETFIGTPMFSPDGQQVAFLTLSHLKRIAIDGGAPITIAPLSLTGLPSGGSWGPNDMILFAQPEGIWSVPASGGTLSLLIPAKGGEALGAPSLLPDLDTVLFTATARAEAADWGPGASILAQRISTAQRTVLVEGGSDGRYLPTGHLVYAVGNDLMAVGFDARRLTVSGKAVLLLPEVRRQGPNANYGVGDDGTLVFVPGANFLTSSGHWRLAVSDRTGTVTSLPIPADRYGLVRLSPDGRRLAVEVESPTGTYIAIYDLDGRTALRRLTFEGNNRYPTWSRDGQRVTFQSDREGDRAVFWQPADGTGPAERLTTPEKDTAHVPASWSPRDEVLLLSVVPVDSPLLGGVFTYTRGAGRVAPFGGVTRATLGPVFSPDGRWVAYASGGGIGNDGTRRLYVQPFPATGAKYEVPVPKGASLMTHPFWALDGSALYFSTAPGKWGIVPFTTQPAVAFGNPSEFRRRLPSLGPWAPRGAEIMPDGRFVGRITADEAPSAETARQSQEIRIVLNWIEELKRLVPGQ